MATLCSLTALVAMLAFWLTMMDGLRTARHSFAAFYLPKLAWALVLWLCHVAVAVANAVFGAHDDMGAGGVRALNRVGVAAKIWLFGVRRWSFC
jgi:hypothetical protein